MQIFLTLLVPLALLLAWAGGQSRSTEATINQLQNISSDFSQIVQIGDNLYQTQSKRDPQDTLYIVHLSQPSYGGPMEVAAVVDSSRTIRYTAILNSSDTSSYLEKVIRMGFLDLFIDQPLGQFPQVDAISGATLSSTAINRGIEAAAQKIGAEKFGLPAKLQEHKQATPETIKLVTVCLFFAAALALTSKRVKQKRKARAVLLTLSVIVLGFLLGAQFSLATVVLMLNGSWLKGVATYAALLCLALTIITFLLTRKNLFCSYICPFGAIQEGIGKITSCATPNQPKWMAAVAHGWVFLVVLAALYYQMPSYAMYEPFGKAFNFIGSGLIYSLTILIIIASLVYKRPWCNLLCPTTVVISYLRFARRCFSIRPGKRQAQLPEK